MMEQNKSKNAAAAAATTTTTTTTKTTYLARPRTASLSISVPALTPAAMSHSSHNHRPPSPGGRRINNPNRMSDQGFGDYYSSSSSTSRHHHHHNNNNTYANPRNSVGVIPISTQTFINVPPPTSSRPVTQYDSYSGRPRRSSLVDDKRGQYTQQTSRTRPNIIQTDVARPASPIKLTREKEYYVTPASSESRGTHKKLYSVDDSGAKLVADVNVPASGERHQKRRDSVERSSNYRTVVDRERDRDGRGRRGYHGSGSANRPRDKSIDDEDAYSYTDPAGMYRDTEPMRRDVRPRRGSMDRGGATSRERPVSLLDPTFGLRQTAKDVGPPPSTRGWDKINENLGRTRSFREEPSTSRQHVAQSPTRGRIYAEPLSYSDPYYVAPRTNSTDRRTTVHQYDYGYEEPREVKRERKHSVTRDTRPDHSVERRGFGIRTDLRTEGHSRNESQNRYGRGSDESFEAQKHRDPAVYAEPHRREEDRTKREREVDREREREKVPAERERERHHHRRDTDRDYKKKDDSPRQSGDTISKPSLSQAATGGLAGAAAAFGLTGLLNKVTDKNRDKDREDSKDQDRERERKERRAEEERSERRKTDERERDRSPHRERRPGKATSDEDPRERDLERDRLRDTDRGLGFAFEAPLEPPKRAPSPNNQDWKPERIRDDRGGEKWEAHPPQERAPLAERVVERQSTLDRQPDRPTYVQDRDILTRDADRDYDAGGKAAEIPAPAVDPDEDYRRRMEQVQRELGVRDTLRTEDRGTESDPDRARRRREREQRQREREGRVGNEGRAGNAAAVAGAVDLSNSTELPSRRSLERDDTPSDINNKPALRRRPSIIDQPMPHDTPVQILDNSQSTQRENRVRIVDPPSQSESVAPPKSILKRPTAKFPEDANSIREGVAPLKDAKLGNKGIPPGARWTKIDRRLVNPEALEAAQERFEERLDCVIVLRVLTKEEIQRLADRTRGIRDKRYEEERAERKARRHSGRSRRSEREDRDEYSEEDSADEFKAKVPKALEAPPLPSSVGVGGVQEFLPPRRERDREEVVGFVGASGAERRDREREREWEGRY